jgi:hypothetical protein
MDGAIEEGLRPDGIQGLNLDLTFLLLLFCLGSYTPVIFLVLGVCCNKRGHTFPLGLSADLLAVHFSHGEVKSDFPNLKFQLSYGWPWPKGRLQAQCLQKWGRSHTSRLVLSCSLSPLCEKAWASLLDDKPLCGAEWSWLSQCPLGPCCSPLLSSLDDSFPINQPSKPNEA